MIELKQRTPEESKAYLEGFNNAYNQFCEYLHTEKSKYKAIRSMNTLVKAVNTLFGMKEEAKNAEIE